MAIKALVTVGDFEFPEPSSYTGNTATLVDSARNTQGVMIGSVVRDDVGKVEIGWMYLTVKQWADIQKCFRRSSGGKFINNVTFFDQAVGHWVTKKMYVNDRTAGMWRRDSETGDVLGWEDCALSLIEV